MYLSRGAVAEGVGTHCAVRGIVLLDGSPTGLGADHW